MVISKWNNPAYELQIGNAKMKQVGKFKYLGRKM